MKQLKKIFCCCASGLGSSFFMEMNVKEALDHLGILDVEVSHGAIYEVSQGSADLFIISTDIENEIKKYGDCLAIKNLMSVEEIEEKLKQYLEN